MRFSPFGRDLKTLRLRNHVALLAQPHECITDTGSDRQPDCLRQVCKSRIRVNRVQVAQQRVRQTLRRVFQGNDRVNDGCVDNILHGIGRGFTHGQFKRGSAAKGQLGFVLKVSSEPL